MKQNKLKNYLKFGILLFVIPLFLINCQKDDDFLKTSSKNLKANDFKIKNVSFKDVIKNTLLYEKISNPKALFRNTSNANKTITDSINGFSINTNTGIYIEKGDYHSYTFEINRLNGSDYLLENLVLSKVDTGYETILYQYAITQVELDLIQHRQFVDLEGKIDRTLLENSNVVNEALGKYYFNGNCWEDIPVYVEGQSCPNGHNWNYVNEHAGTDTQCIYLGTLGGPLPGNWVTESVQVACDGGGTGNNTNPDTSTNYPNHGGGGGGSTSTTPNTTCRTCPTLDEDPIGQQTSDEKNCEELQKLLETPTYPIPAPKKSPKNAIIDLQGKLGVWNEQGYTLSHNSSLNDFANPVANANSAQLDYPAHPAVYGGMHTHPTNNTPPVIPMLSHGDINALFQFTTFYNNPNNQNPDPSLFVHILVSSDGVYAIKIDDIAKLQAIQAIYADVDDANGDGVYEKDDFEYRFKMKFRRFFDKWTGQLTGSETQYQKAFLEFISDYDGNGSSLGVSLYKVNAELDTWGKLEIDENEDDDIKETPCN